MYTDETTQKRMIEVELVDNWHARWREVIDAIEHLGQRDCLNIDHDGWLAARHNLLVAFTDDEVAGHVSFRVEPVHGENGAILNDSGRPVVEAQLESLGVQPGFSRKEVEQMLRAAAQRRAASLRCRRLIDRSDGKCEA